MLNSTMEESDLMNGGGKTAQWLRDHADYPHDYCLIWPFTRCRGYGQFGFKGKNHYAHRFMCELRHGPPPSPDHEAAHSCGRGHEGCVNPSHLSWKTRSENLRDSALHGTQARNTHGTQGRVSMGEAHQIRLLKGVKLQREVAEEFGISESTVSDIWLGRTHTRLSKVNYWSKEEDAKLLEAVARRYSYRQIAEHVGRSEGSVQNRLYKLGKRSQWQRNGAALLPNTTTLKAGERKDG